MVSTQRTTGQIDQMPHTKVFGDFPQFDAAGRKDTAQQALAAELGHPVTPGLGSNAQPLEDSSQLRRDRGLPLPKESAGVFDQLEFGYLIG
jgi:hypothetical protein